jgi:hypothetical protein
MEESLPADLRNLRKLIDTQVPERVHFFAEPEKALAAWAQSVGLKSGAKIGSVGPLSRFFENFAREHAFTILDFSRDPEDLIEADFSHLDALIVSNPNLCDSFFYTQGIFEGLLEYFLSFPRLQILSEESTRFFFESSDATFVGTATGSLASKRVSVLGGTFAFSEERLAWLQTEAPAPLRTDSLPDPKIVRGDRSDRLFAVQHGRQMRSVQTQLLFLADKLKRVVDGLRPSLHAQKIEIPVWPYPLAIGLLLDLSKFVESEKLSLSQVYAQLSEPEQKLVRPLHLASSAPALEIQMTARYSDLMSLARRLNEIFLQSR